MNREQARENYLRRVKTRRSDKHHQTNKTATRQFHDYLDEYELDIDDVDKWVIEDWTDWMGEQKDYAPKTLRLKLSCIAEYLDYIGGRHEFDVSKDAVHDAGKDHLPDTAKKESETDVRYIEPETKDKMLEACKNLRDRIMIRCLWQCGLRAQELSNICYKTDIDRDDRSISIDTAKRDDHDRTVWFKRSLGTLLTRWLDRGERDSYMTADESPYLLVTKKNPKMPPNEINRRVTIIADRAGVQEEVYTDADGRPQNRITSHVFRHSYAVHRVKRGMPLPFLQELMGHAEVTTTRDRYLSFRDEDLKEAELTYRP